MAGDIKRQRKSWTLQGSRRDRKCCLFLCPQCIDRSKVSINILRANLAEEGDEDAQLDVAKRLLEENSSPGVSSRVQNENVRLALYWLIKSSEQGNDEATQLLKECLQSGRGLTAQNILDVRTCVSTPKYEKLTFKAARLLHRKLSNGEEFITTTQLLARVNMSVKNVTFQEKSNGEVQHEEIYPDEDNVENVRENGAIAGQHSETERNSSDTVPLLEGSERIPLNKIPIDLNSTFIISKSTTSNTVPSVSNSKTPEQSPTKSSQNSSPKHHHHRTQVKAALPAEHLSSDLQLSMKRPGKKLTLNDLLNVAKDFNLGNTPQVSLDERNRILKRHVWHANSFLNSFILQILVLAVAGNMMGVSHALEYLVYLGCMWSSYNFLLWKYRFRDFTDWKLAFSSVLSEESWQTDKFKMNLTGNYLMHHLVNVIFGLLYLQFAACDQFTYLTVTVGVTLIICIQLGIFQRFLLGWRQILLVSMSLLYFQSTTVNHLLSENFTEQSKFLHESLSSVESLTVRLPFQVNMFTVVTCLVLATTVKFSLARILSETLPQIVLSLWLIRIVQAYGELDTIQFLTGAGAGLVMVFLMALFLSKLEIWKTVLVILTVMLVTIAAGCAFTEIKSSVWGEKQVGFLDWEEYESSCHRKAWTTQTPAATQIKCSTLYGGDKNEVLVKWKGRITIVKVEKLFHGTSSWKDIVFDISVGIVSNQGENDGSRQWQNFLSSSNDGGDTLAPASVIVSTMGIQDQKRKQNLVDHILNFRSGDKIEFIGRLKGSSVGNLKPQIIDVQRLQCFSCSMADYGEFIVANGNTNYDFGWIREKWSSEQEIDTLFDYALINEYRQILLNMYVTLKTALAG